jgi:hypothetical protein
MWEFPATWCRGVELWQHIDVAMHLIFLGIIKTVMQDLHEWMSMREKGAAFLRYSSGMFEAVQKLGLSWCRCQPYKTGKLGGWISENYMAAARLMNWFYSEIESVATDPIFVPPDKPMHKWTKKENHAWLKIRGLQTAGNAEVLQNRVSGYINSTEGPPQVLDAPGGSSDNVSAVISALSAMVSQLMARAINEAHVMDVDRHIKLFLSAYEQFDKETRGSNDTPGWITSYNFCCLLNYPAVIREFGPLRNLWEGGGMGEKILRLVKPSWNGFRKRWQYNKMDKVLRKMAMIKLRSATLKTEQTEKFCDDYDDSDADDDMDENTKNDFFAGSYLFKRYTSEAEVKKNSNREFQCLW